jgi:hypothetical protein
MGFEIRVRCLYIFTAISRIKSISNISDCVCPVRAFTVENRDAMRCIAQTDNARVWQLGLGALNDESIRVSC